MKYVVKTQQIEHFHVFFLKSNILCTKIPFFYFIYLYCLFVKRLFFLKKEKKKKEEEDVFVKIIQTIDRIKSPIKIEAGDISQSEKYHTNNKRVI